jgi:hypothetical protein
VRAAGSRVAGDDERSACKGPADLHVRGYVEQSRKRLRRTCGGRTRSSSARNSDSSPGQRAWYHSAASTNAKPLECHLRWVKEEALRRGWGEAEWLFPNDEGRPHEESRVRKAFKRALRSAKLPAFRFYDLRHTFASLLLAAGAPITS